MGGQPGRRFRLLVLAIASAAVLLALPPAASATITVFGRSASLTAGDQACLNRAMAGETCDEHSVPGPGVGSGASPFSYNETVTAPTATVIDPNLGSASGDGSAHLAADLVLGAGLRISADGSMGGSGSAAPEPGNTAEGFGAGVGEVSVQFQTTEPLPYDFTGSASGSDAGPQPDRFANARLTTSPQGTIVFRFDSRSNPQLVEGAAKGTLPPGQYSFGAFYHATAFVRSTSAASASSSQRGTFSLTVGGATCGASEVPVGNVVAQGCFTEQKDFQGNGTGVFETDQPAWVGGFPLEPRSGGKLLVVPADQAAPLRADGAGVDLVMDSVRVNAPLNELKPFLPSFTAGVNIAGAYERLAALPFLQGASGQVKVSWAPGGKGAKVEAQASLEDMTKNVGEAFAKTASRSVGTLSAKLTLALLNGAAVDITQGELQVPEFAVQLKGTDPPLKQGFGGAKFKAQKVGGKIEWSGEGTLLFPWENDAGGSNQGSITGRWFFTDGQWVGVGLAVSGFERPIGRTGWDLTGVDGNLIVSPLAFDFGVTAQQRAVFAGLKLFKLTGNVKGLRLAATDCRNGTNPFEFVGTANVPPLEQRKIGLGKLQVLMCAYVPSAGGFAFEAGVSGELTFDAPGVTKLFAAKGAATGWFQGAGSARSLLRTDFNLDGSFQLQIPVIGTIGATGVLSSEGYAFCGQYGFISTGLATHNWIDPPTDLTGCDFTPYRVATQPPLPTAPTPKAGIARAGKRVKVVAGQSAVAVALSGAATAPRVRVRGPHGERFVTPRGSTPLKTRAAIIVPIDELHTTYIYLHRPAAGQWRFDPLAGSAPIGRLRTASQVPRPRVRARLKLKAGKATLRWQARPIRGQQIQLVDRAGAGVATVVQPTTGHSHGTIHFRPANPLVTRRRIEAVVLQNGVPRATLTVAHYHIKRPARPGRVSRVKATRTATGLAITWRRARHARDYVISVTQGSTVLTRTVTTGTALTFESPPAGPLAVVIQPRDALERTGPASTLAVP